MKIMAATMVCSCLALLQWRGDPCLSICGLLRHGLEDVVVNRRDPYDMFISFVDACRLELGPKSGRASMHGVIVALVIAPGTSFMLSHSTCTGKRQNLASGTMSSSLGPRTATAYTRPLASAVGSLHPSSATTSRWDRSITISLDVLHNSMAKQPHISARAQAADPQVLGHVIL